MPTGRCQTRRRRRGAGGVTPLLYAWAFLAVGRGERDVVELVKAERSAGHSPLAHGAVVAQVWRGGPGRQAGVAGLLHGVDVSALDEEPGKKAGVLVGRSRSVEQLMQIWFVLLSTVTTS